MRKFFLILLIVLVAPAVAQEHLERVYGRENERLHRLMLWSPGEKQPELPPVLKFDPAKIVIAPPQTPVPRDLPSEGATQNPAGFTTWIVNYNKGISLAQADLISRTIVQYARQHNVDPKLVVALVAAESAFRIDARSPVGAQGLGQLMPGTAAMLGVSNPFEPTQNISGTVRYLSTQLRRWNSPALALASYNAGPGAVQRYGGIPPYRETQEYVTYVLRLHRELKSLEERRRAVSQNKTRSDS
jgi:hypothetical protein